MIKEFKKEYNIVYVNCHKATLHLGFKVFKESINEGIIKFRVKASIWSFGEDFKIIITSKSALYTTVEVTSDGSVGLQVIDWGKNKRNVNDFFETLTSSLKL